MGARWTLAWVLWLAASGLLCAQEPREMDGFPDMPPERFLEIAKDRPDGLGVSVSWLKYSRVFGEALKVYDEGFQDVLVVRDARLKALLETKGQDSTGEPLDKRQNIQVVGTGMRQRDGGYVLIVQRVYGLEGDLERFTRRSRALRPNDAPGRLALAQEIQERARVSLIQEERPPVLELARRLEHEALTIERAELPALPGGADAWLRFGQRYRRIEELAELVAHDQVPRALKLQAETMLERFAARRYLGRWMSEEAYNEAVGFVQLGDRYVPRQHVELREAAAEQLRLMADPDKSGPWPPASEQFLLKAAQEGSIVKGQRKPMALRAIQLSTGRSQLPERVDRWRQRVEGQEAARIWERWKMPDGRLLFFLQGRVFKAVEPE